MKKLITLIFFSLLWWGQFVSTACNGYPPNKEDSHFRETALKGEEIPEPKTPEVHFKLVTYGDVPKSGFYWLNDPTGTDYTNFYVKDVMDAPGMTSGVYIYVPDCPECNAHKVAYAIDFRRHRRDTTYVNTCSDMKLNSVDHIYFENLDYLFW
ncbi:MAG: hypothetical protein Pg6B_11000 [Candidatus Azobacteroides pseudotrichonymphae]|nr:MAG: hypothetical protein Pg6B_11000 [Candidatus Azobacteroides pseudotrichonymphae]